MNFTPEPIDTSNIVLTKDILDLTELLARNFHDIWALQQLNNGWRFGPKKDHFIKENPCLIPFEDMPESLKEFDRRTALEILKAIFVLGYKIEKV